jgi:16S rRNA (cytosine967-C5)-methyltransferase
MSQAPQTVALWQQLQAVAQALVQVRKGTSATVAVAAVPPHLRAGVQALLFQVLRQLGRAQALRSQLAKRAPPPLADALLCTALALAWRDEEAPYEPHTLVNQAVEAAKKTKSLQAQANFLNACLRRFLRERDVLVQTTDSDLQAVWNHPVWWVKRLQQDYPEHWQSILQVNNQPAPMTLRVNTQKTTREQLQQRWLAQGIEAQAVGEQGLVLTKARAVHDIPGFAEGECSVQDAAAQYAAPCLLQGLVSRQKNANAESQHTLRVLDACAAPGGKTAHLLELLDKRDQVLALDIDAARCERIAENLQRLQLHAQVVVADAAHPKTWWDGESFDAILLDAPCTASGIVRRHPDVRWLRRETDSAQLAQVQAQLLTTLWPLLKPGGRMLYCTCSVFKLEGELPVKAFLQHNTDARLLPSVGHLRPQNHAVSASLADNLAGDHDGFYYALLEKTLPS